MEGSNLENFTAPPGSDLRLEKRAEVVRLEELFSVAVGARSGVREGSRAEEAEGTPKDGRTEQFCCITKLQRRPTRRRVAFLRTDSVE